MTDAAKIAARLDELDRRELTTIEEADLIAIARAALECVDMTDNCAGVPTNADSLPQMVKAHLQAALSKLAEGR